MSEASGEKRSPGQQISKASPHLRQLAGRDVDELRQQARDYGALREGGGKRRKTSRRVEFPAGLESMSEAAGGDDAEAPVDEPTLNVYLRLDRPAGPPGLETLELELADAKTYVWARGGVCHSVVTRDQLRELLEDPRVISVELPDPIRRPLVLRSEESSAPPGPREGRTVGRADLHGGGKGKPEEKGLLIGVIDVEGFDFSHEDFLIDGKTRFVRIWDQGKSGGRPSPEPDGRFDYGSEFLKEHLDRAISKSEELQIAPYHLEQQSAIVPGSHGTHVASIAAGNLGVCPKADIAAVLIHLPEEDWDRRRSFTDSTRINDAVDYLLNLKETKGYRAVSINISLGTNGHAHDGTAGACRWIDAALTSPGRSVSIAAGNAGQEDSQSIDDLGFVVGRIHTGGRIAARGLERDVTLEVAGFPIEDVSQNEIEIWYAPQDRLAVSVRPPDAGRWIGPVRPGASRNAAAAGSDGEELGTEVSVFNDLYVAENGANRISVFLKPTTGPDGSERVAPGTWNLRLHGLEIRDGRYDGWIERDDPIPVQGLTPQRKWHYPAFFTDESNVDRCSISSLACTREAIAVANLDANAEKMAVTSSQGPSRDGQLKPELCAPGTNVVAACGFHPKKKWIRMSGTSMASPYVAGVAGLMLNMFPRLMPAQVKGIMLRTTRPLPGFDYTWRDDAGYGRIDPEACIVETYRLMTGEEP